MREGQRFTIGCSRGPLCTPTRQHGAEFKSTWEPADHLTFPQALKQANPAYVCAHFGKYGEDMIAMPD